MATENQMVYSVDHKKLEQMLKESKVSSGAILTLLFLIKRLGNKNVCWPSQKCIAENVYKSERQVRNYITELRTKGFIEWKHGGSGLAKNGNTYFHKSNHYDLANVLKLVPKFNSRNEPISTEGRPSET